MVVASVGQVSKPKIITGKTSSPTTR
jgi:hypothetical protein